MKHCLVCGAYYKPDQKRPHNHRKGNLKVEDRKLCVLCQTTEATDKGWCAQCLSQERNAGELHD
jgi:predicted nucleic acid-binding Zn ribbon protein